VPVQVASTKVMFIKVVITNPDSIESGLVITTLQNKEKSFFRKDHFLSIERIKPYIRFIIVSWTRFN
jgi:hypothetical protein